MNNSPEIPFTSIQSAAPNIDILINYLEANDNGKYLYRGQTEFWAGPLFPSGYRRYKKTGKVFTKESSEYKLALRKVASSYIDLIPINYLHDTLSLFYPFDVKISLEEIPILYELCYDQFLARTLKLGMDAFEDVLSNSHLHKYRSKLIYWKDVIDNHHRVEIREFVFMNPFGYLLGQGLAQQYGFASEMLDVTTDLNVAVFFATHRSPEYKICVDDGIGVIYRFKCPDYLDSKIDIGDYDFYSCPPLLDFNVLFSKFTYENEKTLKKYELENFLVETFKKKKWRQWDDLKISNSILNTARFSRQKAALFVPDLILKETGISKGEAIKQRQVMAVEDCSQREGTSIFFFQHGKRKCLPNAITRDYLWPNDDDAFFKMICNALRVNVFTPSGRILPNREDLLDRGFID